MEPDRVATLPAHPAGADHSTRRWLRIALWLVGATLLYNVLEAVIALAFGRKADSIALVGFGLDSCIEVAAALALFWRLWLQGQGEESETAERRERAVHRFVGATFFLLALYILAEAGWTLWAREAPRTSPVGIALAVASLIVMPLVSLGKLRAAREMDSPALRAEALETLACSYLSLVLLLGLGLNAALGWWWSDPAAALLMLPWLVKEGLEGLRGDGCDHD